MIRYRVSVLLLASFNLLVISTAENAPQIAENKRDISKPPDKLILQKSQPYTQADSLIDTLSNWIKNPLDSTPSNEKKSSEDLTASAAEYAGAKYLPPAANFRGHARSCYECNSEPWIPIAGRSLHFPPSSSHSNSLEENVHHNIQPYFKEKHSHGNNNKQFTIYHPPIDQYGAPQGSFDFPPIGEVVDFMLPPPYKSGNIISGVESLYGAPSSNYGSPKQTYAFPKPILYGSPRPQYGTPQPVYGPPKPSFSSANHFNLGHSPSPEYRVPFRPKSPSINYGSPLTDISPPPLVSHGPASTPLRNFAPSHYYGPPPLPSSGYGPTNALINNYRPTSRPPIPTTYLKPVSQDFQPPLPGGGIHTLPLENNLPPAVPSDSYGRPVNLPLALSNSYGTPSGQFAEPITSGSGESDDYGKQVAFNTQNHFLNFEAQHSSEFKASLYQKGLTDVQVVPSVRIADYTASVEYPINLIQSPILDLNIRDQESINKHIGSNFKSEIQQTSYEDSNESQNVNDYGSRQKLSENPIVVDDTYTSASNINTTYSSDNSTAIKRNNDKFLSSEAFNSYEDKEKEIDLTNDLIQKLILEHNIIEDPKTQIVDIQKTVINPHKVQPSGDYSSWYSGYQSTIPTLMIPPKPPVSTWLTPVNESFVSSKHPKKLQIIVPYLKSPQWNNGPHQQSTAIYNRDYSTLAPVFVPPAMTTKPTSLWTQLVEEIRTAESHKEHAHGFAKSTSTTEVYNIKDVLANKEATRNKLPYDIISLQKNIDDWTHQAYSNRHTLEGKLTTKLAHVKNIPGEYFTTTPNYSDFREIDDHVASSSNKKEFISQEIEANLILPEETTTSRVSTKKPSQSSTVSSVRFIVRQPKPSWEETKVSLSNSTHEKVYVVTPQSYTRPLSSTPATAYSMAPRIQNGRLNNVPTMTRISVRVETPSNQEHGKDLKPVKVVYSEWPHLINDLATTTTPRPTSWHPLFGLMDLAPYTVPFNSTVETIGGHSKVANGVTSPIYTSTTPMTNTNSNETVKILPVA